MIKKVTREEAIDYLEWIRPKKPYTGDRMKVQAAIDMGIEALKEQIPIGKEEIALNIACDLLIGSILYGYDYDRIFEEIMERDGCVSSLSIKDFILDNIETLGKEYFVKEGVEK